MKASFGKIVLAVVLVPVLAAGQASAPSKAPRVGAPPTASSSQSASPPAVLRPSPTPIPSPANPGVALAPIETGPQYSPRHLDFGIVAEGQSGKRTLTLTPPMAGDVALSLGKSGQFWVAEYREMGPLGGGSKNSPMGPLSNSIQRQLKSRTTYQVGQVTDLQWNVSAGSQIQIDVVFQPTSEPKGAKAPVPSGPIAIWVQLSGPGTRKPWSLEVPACGVFQAKAPLVQGPGTGAPSGPQVCPQY